MRRLRIDTENRDAFFATAVDFPQLTIGTGGALTYQCDGPVAALYAAPALGLPLLVPRFLGRHVDERKRATLVLRLAREVLAGPLVLDSEGDEDAVIYCHRGTHAAYDNGTREQALGPMP